MTAIRHVYLFDIDGTLVSARGMGSNAFRRAVHELTNFDLPWEARDFAGMTDAGLFRRALSAQNLLHDDSLVTSLATLYHEYLEHDLAKQPALVLPGAREIVTEFASQNDIRVGLLTGNTRRGSELKLAGLWKNFGFGFYGDNHVERSDLGVFAREQITAEFGAQVTITIVGDTPNDILCARAAGAECIAVATGAYSAEELAAADRVLSSLTEWR